MNTKFNLLFIILAYVFSACSQNLIESPSDSGKVSLKFNKINIPENVVNVRATLTKVNHEPIIGSLNLLDNNSAEIYLDLIPVGQWHLLVQAFDEADSVLFMGETEITIIAGQITTVSLSLQSTNNGTGLVYIIVDWGQSGWLDYINNPILEKLNNQFDYTGVSHPYVLKDVDNYKMWFHGLSDNGKAVIYLAVSQDEIGRAHV